MRRALYRDLRVYNLLLFQQTTMDWVILFIEKFPDIGYHRVYVSVDH